MKLPPTPPYRRTVLGALSAVVLLAVSACSGASAEADPDDLVIVIRNDPDSFDPAVTAADTGSVQIHEALYDTLIRQDYETREYTPAMATEWTATPTRVDFTLKPGLKCADGTDLTPTDIASSITRLGDPATGSIYTGRVFGPGGFKRAVADDAKNTLFVEVNEPHTDLLEGLRNAFIVCPKGLADEEKLAVEPQGSGPYRLVEKSRGDTYVLERWDSPAVEDIEDMPERITMKVVTSDTTRANMLETGQADIVSVLGRDAKRLEASREPIEGRGYQADTLLFNQREGRPGADQRVRLAVAYALDNEDYTRAASFDVAEPSDTIITPNMDCYREANGEIVPDQDLEKAVATLEEAGYGPDNPLELKLIGYDEQNSGPDYVADALRKVGIDVEVVNGTQAQAAGIVYGDKEEWDIIVFPMMSASPIPYPMVTKLSSNLGEGGSYNFPRLRNQEFDDLTNRAPGLTGAERCEAWSAAEAALLERVDGVPLMWPVAHYYTNGFTFQTIQRTIDLRTIRPVED
jgi:peptide/nickel transport system substrate-binding protein